MLNSRRYCWTILQCVIMQVLQYVTYRNVSFFKHWFIQLFRLVGFQIKLCKIFPVVVLLFKDFSFPFFFMEINEYCLSFIHLFIYLYEVENVTNFFPANLFLSGVVFGSLAFLLSSSFFLLVSPKLLLYLVFPKLS